MLTGLNRGNRTMKLASFDGIQPAATVIGQESLVIAQCLAAAAAGETIALYDLGVIYSTGSHGAEYDLIEAHKWFNLAASHGHEEAAWCRADISDEMTAREIAEAQRRARDWLVAERRAA